VQSPAVVVAGDPPAYLASSCDALGTLQAAGEASEPWTIAGTQIRNDGHSSYEYDAEGRLIGRRRRTLSGKVLSWTYTWDALGQLVRAETPDQGTWTYDYDPLGRRCSKNSVDADGNILERTVFTHDGPRLVEERREEARGGEAITTTWDYEPDSFIPTAQSRRRETGELSDAYVHEQFHAIAAHLAAYAGLAPVTRRSGTSIKGEVPSLRGNRALKRALFLSAFASLSHPPSRTYYERKISEGKRHNQALLCLARRRCDVLYAMIRNGAFYDASPASSH